MCDPCQGIVFPVALFQNGMYWQAIALEYMVLCTGYAAKCSFGVNFHGIEEGKEENVDCRVDDEEDDDEEDAGSNLQSVTHNNNQIVSFSEMVVMQHLSWDSAIEVEKSATANEKCG